MVTCDYNVYMTVQSSTLEYLHEYQFSVSEVSNICVF